MESIVPRTQWSFKAQNGCGFCGAVIGVCSSAIIDAECRYGVAAVEPDEAVITVAVAVITNKSRNETQRNNGQTSIHRHFTSFHSGLCSARYESRERNNEKATPPNMTTPTRLTNLRKLGDQLTRSTTLHALHAVQTDLPLCRTVKFERRKMQFAQILYRLPPIL